MPEAAPTVEQHFEGKDLSVRETYDRLLAEVGKIGEFTEDPKKTSIHLNRRTAFAGVATRKSALVLTLKASQDIPSSRVKKHEQASANRWLLEVPLSSPAEVDAEVASWLKAAYQISG
ncbi:MAG TPA: DUF5655 domain-containing protein [Thermoanaerobaculia bacterium]|jgi:hypothetical protein|nr:DUF5655 domain-containing protein [Thermoanaerobaculia bacterium]